MRPLAANDIFMDTSDNRDKLKCQLGKNSFLIEKELLRN
jgi:hypothetical protein